MLTRTEILRALVSGAAGFVIIAALIHRSIAHPLQLYAGMRSEKLEILSTWRGRARSAVFGSSHVHNGFDPRAFDLELRGTPLQTTTINLAVEGGSQTEQRAMALEFLQDLRAPDPASGACFVLLELNAGANFKLNYLVHPRTINIYDWDTTRFVLRLSDQGVSTLRSIGRDGFALAALALHDANVGMLSNLTFAPPLDGDQLRSETADDRRGILNEQRTARSSVEIDEWLALRPAVAKPSVQPLSTGNYDLLRELASHNSVSNVHFMYFVTPKLSDLGTFPQFPDTIDGPAGTEPILSVARPDRYPQLYQKALWQDMLHLNEAGAAMAARLLADQLKAWYGSAAPPMCGR